MKFSLASDASIRVFFCCRPTGSGVCNISHRSYEINILLPVVVSVTIYGDGDRGAVICCSCQFSYSTFYMHITWAYGEPEHWLNVHIFSLHILFQFSSFCILRFDYCWMRWMAQHQATGERLNPFRKIHGEAIFQHLGKLEVKKNYPSFT